VCGSLGVSSTNQAALDVAVDHLRSLGEVDVGVADLSDIPMFRADQAGRPPESVARLRQLLESADAVLIAAPEYAGGLAGGVKNALDWLVGSGSLYHRVVGVLTAGTTGGEHALDQLIRTLSWQGALVVSELGISAPRTKSDDRGRITDPGTLSDIASWGSAVMTARTGTASERLAIVSAVVTPHGIDVARFGDLA